MGVCSEDRWVPWSDRRSPSSLSTDILNNNPSQQYWGGCPTPTKPNTKLDCALSNESCRSLLSHHSLGTPEKTMFDESSSANYSDVSRNDCYELATSCKSTSFKTEPCGPPSSPESTSREAMTPGPDDCAGCGRMIQDRFYLSAVEKRWHNACLQCCICRQTLDRETSCFSRDENIYCKTDYYRVFGAKRCTRCLASISPTELVMRVRNLVFHINCFSCAVCNLPLTKGDQFGVKDTVIYCRSHFGISLEIQIAPCTSLSNNFNTFSSPSQSNLSPLDTKNLTPNEFCVSSSQHLTGLSQPSRQKGRPRKRKPKDLDALHSNIDLTTEYLDFGRGGHLTSSRTKRMRTSFKHHQLRTMKSYFAVNHNPDAKDLKQLSQKTGLPKRVLQVWFQNARAKWRRMMMKQDGKIMTDRGDGSLDLDNFNSHSPTFMLGGPPSPHSLE
ncbi:LHX2 family protein [Megaselia abdita]